MATFYSNGVDESMKPWSDKFEVTGKNTHGQSWEDIFGTPEHPSIERKPESTLCQLDEGGNV